MNFNGFDVFAESQVFKDIIKKEVSNLNIAFVCFYGSMNYNLQTDKSDIDFFIVYYPTFDNFYNNKFERFSVIEKEYDYFITPINEYIGHAMKGNVKFIEPIICETIFEVKDSKVLKMINSQMLDRIKNFILINFRRNFNALMGMAGNKKLNVEKGLYTSNTLKYKETYGYDIKEAINSLRILFLLDNYIKTGEFSFAVSRNSIYNDFEDYLLEINEKKITKNDYMEIIQEKMSSILSTSVENKIDLLEEKMAKIRIEMETKIKNDVMRICRDNAC
ncbi:nucleotidyltransferase domain-containing protein [Candidatus Acidulodesulfobacterium sp. H_13]|uniref:nucleotidyltransferase domain-containing protein n=1 Tax=Candidatus Acidulodesulfobacterium sp. H_13 TaxID=3395470 RepID=UPI003AF54A6A